MVVHLHNGPLLKVKLLYYKQKKLSLGRWDKLCEVNTKMRHVEAKGGRGAPTLCTVISAQQFDANLTPTLPALASSALLSLLLLSLSLCVLPTFDIALIKEALLIIADGLLTARAGTFLAARTTGDALRATVSIALMRSRCNRATFWFTFSPIA